MPAQFGLIVSDQLTAHIYGYFVNLTGEWEWRLVLRRHRCARVRAADYGAEQSDGERIGKRDVALSDQLAVDVDLALARRAFAVSDVGFVCHLEFKPPLMTACGHGFGGFDIIQVPTNIVIGMAEFPVLDIKRVATVIAALREQHAFCATLGNLHVCGNAIRAVEYVGSGVDWHTLGARVEYVRCTVDCDLRALIGKARCAARIYRQDIVLARLDVPSRDHL